MLAITLDEIETFCKFYTDVLQTTRLLEDGEVVSIRGRFDDARKFTSEDIEFMGAEGATLWNSTTDRHPLRERTELDYALKTL